ncbi:S9 family peptidase [Mucilaginibacter sp. FT3.2]|uniref:S9 family peptidase n=1 Tax=Mucilaginibacter sp. FT3.2 TaxID=2723090 RepID=UPI00161BFEC0|nr:prolyl oligopeptidase family serine peptidase [Mucilaginibacter sp. FT3.2]MBB6232615.1 dipeptidyl aminopeptidase/acylaminoacyl peptidase [Mucilaginibacter sp. FT3.2]
MKKLFTLLLLAGSTGAYAQKLDTLTIEKIMRDPKWIGVSPSNIRWSDDSKKILFNWNDGKTGPDELFAITPGSITPQKVSIAEQRSLPANGSYNKKHTQKVFEKGGDLFLEDIKTGKIIQLTHTEQRESAPVFSGDESRVIYSQGSNLFALKLNGGGLEQLTNFVKAKSKKSKEDLNQQEQWLKKQQQELFDIIKVEQKQEKQDSTENANLEIKGLKELAFGDKKVGRVKISPDERFITYRLTKPAEDVKDAIVPNYVTESGFTEDIPNRSKVGRPSSTSETYIFDSKRDTVYRVNTADIPGIKDQPDYLKDYPKEQETYKKANADRQVAIEGVFWSENSANAIVVISAQDNKDRWIMRLDAVTGKLNLLDRQRDEAWIGGPGIENSAAGSVGFVDDNHFYFQSEASGYSHLYICDVNTDAKKQLTNGKWEVQTLYLSNDKKKFYFTANIDHPGATNFYSIPVDGGTPTKITGIKGGNEVTLSPDEKWLAIRYSYSNKPWELYVQANKPGAKAVQVTNSVSAEYMSYPWRDPEIITFKNRYGSDVYARLYLPKHADPAKPAVVFVHGAGYLQEVTYSWSYYFREFMFNNMLADNGYTVLDVDYTASAGYGRDWRTGIYRHMGGKDLSDQVDGVKYLVDKYGVNPKHVGLYGGSYGGFITLMGMFTEPDVFAAGGAIRSVTDWAHYNHEYTANILNEPFTDELAYRKSSPIYFANGLKGNLLMLHGMIDQNVNYQDIIRLSQKLIELHKENWELASYPVEDHGFEQPSSWADEYKRIFKLFEQTLKK